MEENRNREDGEWLDVVDGQGRPTGEIVERSEAHRRGIRHRSSHVWLFRQKENTIQILLQKRSPGKDSFPGCYDISSAGHIPAGVDFVPSALRELKEELGVEAAAEELTFCGQRSFYYEREFYGQMFRDRQVSNVYALWLDREASDFTLQQEEVEAVKWFDFEECRTLVRENRIPHCIYEEELEMLGDYLRSGNYLKENRRELHRRGAEAVTEGATGKAAEEAAAGKAPEEPAGQITYACMEDMERILYIYDIAKQYMRRNGNLKQWNGIYPDRDTLARDIQKGQLYVYKLGGIIHGVFVLQLGEEPNYAHIEGKGWLNEEPYATIHRIASDGAVKGFFEKCLEFSKRRINNIRVDTHHDNHTMQHVVEKYGFRKCGIIHLPGGDPRIAYQYVQEV